MSEEKIEQKTEEAKPNDKEYNFAQIRKQLEQERAEKKQLAEKIAALEKKVSEPRPDQDEDDDDEPYVDQKRLRKHLSRFEQKLSAQFSEEAEHKAAQLLEKERQNQFLKTNSDFSSILSQENIQKFADNYPDIAEQMLELPDSFARQKLLYQNIKALGVHKKEEPKSIQSTIDQNRRSPYYLPSGISNSPYSGTGDFSVTGQKTAYNKMQELKSKLRI